MTHYWAKPLPQFKSGEMMHDMGLKLSPQHECDKRGCPDLTSEDIISMQEIDADCNDCKHFERGQLHKSPGLNWFDGRCLKFNRPTKAYPGQYTGWECFEHRRK